MLRQRGACAVAVAFCATAAVAQETCKLDGPALAAQIPAQPLTLALNNLTLQTRLQWMSEADLVAAPASRRVRAGSTPEEALRAMLRGSGLRFECVSPRLVVVSLQPPPPPVAEASGERPDETLSEVVVTGLVVTGRRNQPIPTDTAVWHQQDMANAGIKGIDEIARLTPGVEFDFLSNVGGGVYTTLAIRGVTDRHGNAAGVWFDDIPLPATSSNSFARGFPFAFDLARAEVLRGPQPALLGANAQGGAVQFMSRTPGLDEFGGAVRAEWSATAGGDPSWEAGAAFGGPLAREQVGFRVSGWYRADGGYVDRLDPFTRAPVARDANRALSRSARAALRIDPVESVTLIPALYYQSTQVRDSSLFMIWESPGFPDDTFSDPRAGRFHNGSLIVQPFEDTYRLASLKGLVRLGGAQLQSVTGHFRRSAYMISDDTESMRWGGFGNPRGPAYPSSHDDLVRTHVTLTQRSFTQQLQLASAEGRALSWVAGGFHSNTHTVETDHVSAANTPPALLALGFDTLDLTVPTRIVQRQWAGFAQARYRPGRLALSAGLRVEHQRSAADSTPPLEFHARRSSTVTAPQYGVSWNAGDAQQGRGREYYFAAGKGYAPGSIDAARPTCLEKPAIYTADTLWSYEAGTRQSWRQGRVQLDFNVFQIRWDNGPEARSTCLFKHLPGKARSDGLGLTARARLSHGFEARVAVSYVDARHTQTLRNDGSITVIDVTGLVPQNNRVVVSAGDAVGTPPQVNSPWNLTASLEKRIALGGQGALELRLENVYRSRNPGPFYTDHPEAMYPAGLEPNHAINQFNFRTRFVRGNLDVGLFINNLFDARPVLLKRNKGNDVNTLYYATTLRPRSIGLSAGWTIRGDR